MASIEKRTSNGTTSYYARYRDPSGHSRSRSFSRRTDAQKFLATTEAAKLTGNYVDACQASRLFRDLAESHWRSYAHTLAADTTRPRKRSNLDNHILPVLGDVPVSAIKPSSISAAIATWSMTLAPGTAGQVLRQVRQILDVAVADGLVPRNVAKAVKAPAAPRRRDVHLSDQDVCAVLDATPAHYYSLVVTLAGLGLRVSEACGLRIEDVDFLRRVVRVRNQRRPGGELGRLKSDSAYRDIPAEDVVLEALAETIRVRPRPDGAIFSSMTGHALTKSVAGHLFDKIETATGFTVSPHSMRHYFGSSLVSRGVSVVAVSRWLGHSSPEITWRVYAYLMTNDEGVGRAAMAAAWTDVLPNRVRSVYAGTE